jgi:HD-GYP domain-containing protein (c-di-GMP phosphodiesterase class II)
LLRIGRMTDPSVGALMHNGKDAPVIPVLDAIHALAFVGDLSMGQPTDHSLRTASLAALLTAEAGGSQEDCADVYCMALLRWSGCTANATGFDQLFGDDVGGRQAMLASTQPDFSFQIRRQLHPLAQIHCEVSGDIAAMLNMSGSVETGLRHIFETYDGQGVPGQLKHPHVPAAVYHVALAGDLEILSRVHGVDVALAYISSLGNIRYPAELVALLSRFARDWLILPGTANSVVSVAVGSVALTLVADVIELKLPWLAGYSRQVAQFAQAAAAMQGMSATVQRQLYCAGLVHGIGRVALPNKLWNMSSQLKVSDWEQIRLAPYWTSRAAERISNLTPEVKLASYAYERLNGTGYFRGLDADAITMPQRILAAAVACVALRSSRPWREPFDTSQADMILRDEVSRGSFDSGAVEAVLAAANSQHLPFSVRPATVLTDREIDVLRRISLGESNKEAARSLAVSPSTVRTHVESIFRKLECSTRAAATLKALTLGLM